MNLAVSFVEPEHSGPRYLNILPNSPPNNKSKQLFGGKYRPLCLRGCQEILKPDSPSDTCRISSQLDPQLNFATFLLFSSLRSLLFEATHAPRIHRFNASTFPFPVAVWLSEAKLSLPTDIQQSFIEEVISEEIALGLYTSAMAACLSSGKDLPSIIGSRCIFSPHSTPGSKQNR